MKQIITSLIILISPINLYAWGGSWNNNSGSSWGGSWGGNSSWGDNPRYFKWRKTAVYDDQHNRPV